MKHLIRLILSVFTMFPNAYAGDVVVAISPHQSQTEAQSQFDDIATIYTKIDVGSRLTVINGIDASAIATMVIPDNPAYKHKKPRLKHKENRKALIKIRAFTERFKQGERTLGALNVPLLFNQVARNYPHVSDVYVVGSALFDNPSHPGVNMTQMHIPSDGFISAKPVDSPFGTKGREKSLQDKHIHWLLPNASDDTLHFEALTRFMHLYIHHLGGELVSFTHDKEAAQTLLLTKAKALAMPYKLKDNAKLEMLSTRKFVPQVKAVKPCTCNKAASTPPTKGKQALSVGIEWNAGNGMDLDIFAKPSEGHTIFYGRATSKYGTFYKDIRAGSKAIEMIEFHHPIDVNALRIVVNTFRSKTIAKGIRGKIHLYLAGVAYTKAFTFKDTKGNRGADVSRVFNSGVSSYQSQYFTVADIVKQGVEVAI